MFHFPEIFLKRKDEYLDAFLRDLIIDTDKLETDQRPSVIDVYCGNMQVSPLSRLWNTTKVLESSKVKVQ